MVKDELASKVSRLDRALLGTNADPSSSFGSTRFSLYRSMGSGGASPLKGASAHPASTYPMQPPTTARSLFAAPAPAPTPSKVSTEDPAHRPPAAPPVVVPYRSYEAPAAPRQPPAPLLVGLSPLTTTELSPSSTPSLISTPTATDIRRAGGGEFRAEAISRALAERDLALAALDGKCRKYRQKAAVLSQESKLLQARASESDALVQALRARLKRCEDDRRAAIEELESALLKLEPLARQVEALRGTTRAAEARAQRAEEESVAMRARQGSARSDLEGVLEALRDAAEANHDLEDANTALASDLRRALAALDACQARLHAAEGAMLALGEERDHWAERARDAEARLSSESTVSRGFASERAELESDLARQGDVLEEALTTAERLDKEVGALRARLARAEVWEDKAGAMRKEIDSLKRSLCEAPTAEALRSLSEECASLRRELQTASLREDHLTAETRHLRSQFAEADQARIRLTGDVADLTRSMEGSMSRVRELEQQLEATTQASTAVVRLQSENARLQAEVAALRASVEESRRSTGDQQASDAAAAAAKLEHALTLAETLMTTHRAGLEGERALLHAVIEDVRSKLTSQSDASLALARAEANRIRSDLEGAVQDLEQQLAQEQKARAQAESELTAVTGMLGAARLSASSAEAEGRLALERASALEARLQEAEAEARAAAERLAEAQSAALAAADRVASLEAWVADLQAEVRISADRAVALESRAVAAQAESQLATEQACRLETQLAAAHSSLSCVQQDLEAEREKFATLQSAYSILEQMQSQAHQQHSEVVEALRTAASVAREEAAALARQLETQGRDLHATREREVAALREVDLARASANNIRDEWQSLTARLSLLQQEGSSVSVELQNAQLERESLRRERAELMESIAQLQAREAGLAVALSSARGETAEAARALTQLEEKLAALASEHATRFKHEAAINTSLSIRVAELEEEIGEMGKLSASLEKKAAEAVAEGARTGTALAAAQADAELARSEVERIRANLDMATGGLIAARARADDLSRQLQAAEERAAELVAASSEASGSVRMVAELHATLAQVQAEAQVAAETDREECSRLEGEIASTAAANVVLQAQHTDLMASFEQARSRLAESEAEREELGDRLHEALRELEGARAALAMAEASGVHDTEVTNLSQHVAQLERENQALEGAVRELRDVASARDAAAEARLRESESLLAEARSERNVLEQALAQAESRASLVASELSSLRQQLHADTDRLRADAADAGATLGEARAAILAMQGALAAKERELERLQAAEAGLRASLQEALVSTADANRQRVETEAVLTSTSAALQTALSAAAAAFASVSIPVSVCATSASGDPEPSGAPSRNDEDLRNRLMAAEAARESLFEELDELLVVRDDLKEQVKALRTDNELLRTRLQQMHADAKAKEGRVLELQRAAQEAAAERAAIAARSSALEDTVAGLERHIRVLNDEAAGAREEREMLRLQVHQLQEAGARPSRSRENSPRSPASIDLEEDSPPIPLLARNVIVQYLKHADQEQQMLPVLARLLAFTQTEMDEIREACKRRNRATVETAASSAVATVFDSSMSFMSSMLTTAIAGAGTAVTATQAQIAAARAAQQHFAGSRRASAGAPDSGPESQPAQPELSTSTSFVTHPLDYGASPAPRRTPVDRELSATPPEGPLALGDAVVTIESNSAAAPTPNSARRQKSYDVLFATAALM